MSLALPISWLVNLIRRNFSLKLVPSLIYYVISMDFSPECFSGSQRNHRFWTCFSKLSTENMLLRASVDTERNHVPCKLFLTSHFSILLEQKFLEKGSLRKDMPRVRDSIGAASALLASACVPSSRWCGLWPTLSLGILLARRLRARTRVSLSEYPDPWAQLCRYSRVGGPLGN
jgi:hypothetical protein